MPTIRLALCQINTVVGDLDANVAKVIGALRSAKAAGCDLALFPELTITGYPPEDLLLKPGFVEDNLKALNEVALAVGSCAAVVGFVDRVSGDPGSAFDNREVPALRFDGSYQPASPVHLGLGQAAQVRQARQTLFNAAAVCASGSIRGTYHKRLLPNYGVFDEKRYFMPGGGEQALFEVAGACIGVSICEDAWQEAGPLAEQAASGVELLVNLSASPYSAGRLDERVSMLSERALECSTPLVYVNLVGGQDELVFDGGSMVFGADGALLACLGQFVEQFAVVDIDVEPRSLPQRGLERSRPLTSPSAPGIGMARSEAGGSSVARPVLVTRSSRRLPGIYPPTLVPRLAFEEEIYEALTVGVRDYVTKNGFTDVVVGLSGGIDSSLVAVIAADALGSEHVHAVSMPSRYSSEGSRSDAKDLAVRTGIHLITIAIEPAHSVFIDMLTSATGKDPSGLSDENLQSRIRGVILMALSNMNGWLVLATGNKSELATGYSTLYGDAVGAFAAIKDVPKTLVFSLAKARNARSRRAGDPVEPIPQGVLAKPPSAELRPDQRDDQSLPAYEILDPVLKGYVEDDMTTSDLLESGFDSALVEQVTRLVDQAEYKRRQMPPGVRITRKAFGKDRRMPMTNRYACSTSRLSEDELA